MSDRPTNARPSVMLVDGYGLIFRAYHALPPTLTTASGEQVNAVFGFSSMLLDVLRARKPDHVVVALESGRTFRHDAYDGYKAHRAEMPEDLRNQIDRVKEVIETLNIPIEIRDGYEADDVIGSMSCSCSREGLHVIVVTGDTDLLQLVDDEVEVILPGAKRFGEFRVFDRQAVIDRYTFGPEFIPDYKGLVGDTSDNIPGVPGIGEKTATALINQFGHLENIIDRVAAITPARAQNAIANNIQIARESKSLATIVCDLEIALNLDHSHIGNYDKAKATELFRSLEFRTLVAKLPEPTNNAPAEAEAVAERPERAPSVRTTVRTSADLAKLVARIRETGEYAIDVETTSTDPMRADLVGIAIAPMATEGYYIPVGHQGNAQLPMDEVRTSLQPILKDAKLQAYAHHGKYDMLVLQRHGFELSHITFDSMIAAYLLGENSTRLKDLAFTKLGIEMTEIEALIGSGKNQMTMNLVSSEEAAQYACGDVEATFALTELLRPEIERETLMPLMRDIELALIPVLVEMERNGIAINSDFLAGMSRELSKRIVELDDEVDVVAGRPVNIGSPKQLATLLFEELNLPSGRKTKTGYSVDIDVLEGLRTAHPIVELILEYRTLSKLKSTYVDSLPTQVNPATGRIHTSFNQTIAATGRLSSTNPNLQNIPIRTELGRRVRHAFVADTRPQHRLFENPVLISADYSQIELRLVAHLSGEPFLLDAFHRGEDIHRATAALVYDVPVAEVTSDMRRVAKTVNFGLLYGMQAFGLSRDTGLPRSEAQKFIDQYWSRLPKVKEMFDGTLRFGASKGYVETISGRRRRIPDLLSPNGQMRMAAERMAINMPVQGAAADIMKIAMIHMHDRLVAEKLPARLLLQVHDELVLEADDAHRDRIAHAVVETMGSAYRLDVPLVADVKAGMNWEEMTPIEINRP